MVVIASYDFEDGTSQGWTLVDATINSTNPIDGSYDLAVSNTSAAFGYTVGSVSIETSSPVTVVELKCRCIGAAGATFYVQIQLGDWTRVETFSGIPCDGTVRTLRAGFLTDGSEMTLTISGGYSASTAADVTIDFDDIKVYGVDSTETYEKTGVGLTSRADVVYEPPLEQPQFPAPSGIIDSIFTFPVVLGTQLAEFYLFSNAYLQVKLSDGSTVALSSSKHSKAYTSQPVSVTFSAATDLTATLTVATFDPSTGTMYAYVNNYKVYVAEIQYTETHRLVPTYGIFEATVTINTSSSITMTIYAKLVVELFNIEAEVAGRKIRSEGPTEIPVSMGSPGTYVVKIKGQVLSPARIYLVPVGVEGNGTPAQLSGQAELYAIHASMSGVGYAVTNRGVLVLPAPLTGANAPVFSGVAYRFGDGYRYCADFDQHILLVPSTSGQAFHVKANVITRVGSMEQGVMFLRRGECIESSRPFRVIKMLF